MTVEWQVICINKRNREDRYDSIDKIGVLTHTSEKLILTLDEAIGLIQQGQLRMFVMHGNKRVAVVVRQSAAGNNFLQTEADTTENNNLLSLPEC